MTYDHFTFDGDRRYQTGDIDPRDARGLDGKEAGRALLDANRDSIGQMQQALYAEGTQSLLIILQAMDAAGKDGAIRHVFTGVNPQGMRVTSFKQPATAALMRDYLWRVHAKVPMRGEIGVFNRSHYEDVLIGRVLDLPGVQPMPTRARKNIWEKRYRQIRDFERHLYENGITIRKIYLHLSPEEQRERFLARAEDPAKQFKFSGGDLATSAHWDAYMDAYQDAINETAAPHAPWHVVPADRKWYARAVISQIVLDALTQMNPRYPEITAEQRAAIEAFRAQARKPEA